MAGTTSLENDFLKADIAVEPTLRISVTDKRNGSVWECFGAPFALHYWQTAHFESRRCPADHERGWEFRLLPDDERMAVQCTWPRAACGFRAVLELNGPSLKVRLPGRRLVENRPFDLRLMAIDVLPGFGGARTGAEGFLFIPRERGTLCGFKKSEEHETSLLVYGGGDRGLTAPVFGIGRGAAGLLGIITEGEFSAELVLVANGGPERNLNYVYPRIRTRLHSGDQLYEDAEYRLSYNFLTDGDVSYVGMAKAYRAHLTETRHHPSLVKRFETRSGLAGVASSAAIHVALSEKRRKTRMSGDGELKVKTRFDEAPRLAQQIKDAGIENAVITLVGWNCEGRDGLYPTRFPVESAVGGADAMTRAVQGIRSVGFQVGALDNYTDMYRRSPAFNERFSATQLGGEPWRGGIWAGGQSYIICPQQAADRYVQRDMRRLCDLGLEGLLFLDHCPGPGVLRCYDDEHPLTRSEYARYVREVIKTAQSTFGLCRISGSSVFAALEADSCMCPVQDTPAIDGLEPEWFADEVVPFLPIVLHGIILLAAEADADPLRVVEYGAAPVYNTSTDELSRMLPRMSQFSRRYTTEIAPLAGEFIESHEVPGEGLVKVGYSGGAEIFINRADEPAEIEGVTIGPRDFQVRR